MFGKLGDEKVVWYFGGFLGYLLFMFFMFEYKIGVNVLINEFSVGFCFMYLLVVFFYDWWLKNDDVLVDYKV